MIITPASKIEDKQITQYKGTVFSEVISNVVFSADIESKLTDFVSSNGDLYDSDLIELPKVKDKVLLEIEKKAQALSANAVIGVAFEYDVRSQDDNIILIASGIAVVVE